MVCIGTAYYKHELGMSMTHYVDSFLLTFWLLIFLNFIFPHAHYTTSFSCLHYIVFFFSVTFSLQILIMDEATAAIDTDTDRLIQETIHSAFGSCTTLIVAHRLNTVMSCNRVMVLDNGQVCIETSWHTLRVHDLTLGSHGLIQIALPCLHDNLFIISNLPTFAYHL